MNLEINFRFDFSTVLFSAILTYILLAGAPLNAQSFPFQKAARDKVSTEIPAEAYEKVRQALDRDGFGGTLSAGTAAQTIRINQKAGLVASGPDQGDIFGFSVAVSGDTVVVGAERKDSAAGPESGAAYIFERNEGGAGNWGQVKKLTADVPRAGDSFGASVAISGDTVVVGADGGILPVNPFNAAYIFERNEGGAGNWGQVKKLTADVPVPGDWFGYSVAISGNTVVVGALKKDSAVGKYNGAAYIFERDTGGAGNWGQVKILTAGDAVANDFFGYSAAINGDTVVVGAPLKDSDTGAVFIFERHTGGAGHWGQVKILIADVPANQDWFGNSVAISGDTVVVGAYEKDSAVGNHSGAAYIFERDVGGAGNWGQVKILTAGNAVADDYFGYSAAINGDTVVVGTYKKNLWLGNYSGANYIFERDAGGVGNWGQVKILTAGNAAADDYYSSFVAISGDTVVVGICGSLDPIKYNQRGAAHIFERDDSGPENWGEWGKLIVLDPQPGDQFGFAVAIHQDLALVGVPFRDRPPGDNNYGNACLFSRNQGGTNHWSWIKSFFIPYTEKNADDWFGYSTAIGGEFAFVGTPLQDNTLGQDAGAVYVFRRDQDGPNQWGYFKKLTADDGAAFDHFGISIALSGDTLVIGAWWKNWLAGAAYVFQRHQGGTDNWGQVRKLLAGDGAWGDQFGKSVAISGDLVVVGAYADDDAGDASGSAYVFERNQGGSNVWGQVKKLTALDAGQDDFFGWSVGVAGDWVAVGASKDDDMAQDAGAVYLFHRHQSGPNLWGQVKKITVADGALLDYFGTSLSLNEQFLLVGTNWKDLAGEDSGAAYLFRRDEGGTDDWGLATRFGPADAAAQDKFGFSVALSGDTLLVGALGKNLGGPDAGAAYVFQAVKALFLPLILSQ